MPEGARSQTDGPELPPPLQQGTDAGLSVVAYKRNRLMQQQSVTIVAVLSRHSSCSQELSAPQRQQLRAESSTIHKECGGNRRWLKHAAKASNGNACFNCAAARTSLHIYAAATCTAAAGWKRQVVSARP